MGIGYQEDDRFAFDYDLWFIDQSVPGLRGPRVNSGVAEFWSFIGAAQTFGRLVKHPYPSLIGQWAAVNTVNLGISGAGPQLFLSNSELLRIAKRASQNFIQVLSARSVSAGIFKTNTNNGVLTFLSGPLKGETMLAAQAYSRLWKEYGKSAYDEQVEAVREVWVMSNLELFESLPDSYAIWISGVRPDGIDESISDRAPVGAFPHFVNEKMIAELTEKGVKLIDCTFSDSRPEPIFSEFSGHMLDVWPKDKYPHRPEHLRSWNVYYPTQKNHFHIAKTILRRLMLDGLL